MYLPTVTITDTIRSALYAQTLWLQRGQWVEQNGVKGRFISNKNGYINILWRFNNEAFTSYTLRFKCACILAGKRPVSRPAQSPLTDTAALSPELQQQDAFLQELIDCLQWIDEQTLDEICDSPVAFGDVTVFGSPIEPYVLLMKSRTGQLMKSLVTGRKRLVDNDHAHEYSIWGRSHYAQYPQGWGSACH